MDTKLKEIFLASTSQKRLIFPVAQASLRNTRSIIEREPRLR